MSPRRPNASVKIIPATTGGITMGTKTIDRVSVRPAKSVQPKSNASGPRNTTRIAVDTMELRSDNHKASSAAGLVSNPGTACHVIPANNAMKGSTKNAAANNATQIAAAGTPVATVAWRRSVEGNFGVDMCLGWGFTRSEEHTSELQSRFDIVCCL